MSDVFIYGKRGSGKTLEAVRRIWEGWLEGREIWGNIWLHPYFDYNPITEKRGNYHQVDAVDLIRMLIDEELPETRTRKLLVLDEIKTQANARMFTSFVNRNLVNFVSQARKRGFSIIYTDQILSSYDKWIRQMTDKIIRAIPHVDTNDLGYGNSEYPEPIYFEYREATLDSDSPDGLDRNVKNFYMSRKVARQLYPCYRTEQMITPVELKYSNESGGETE